MIWQLVTGGFVLGLFSSLHCVGMCGPLSLSLPVYHLPALHRFIALLLYQVGRVVTYTVLGFVFGYAGRHIYIAGMQQWFSVVLGVLILFILISHHVYHRNMQPVFLNHFYRNVQHLIATILRSSTSTGSFLLLGMVNGLLPCGMVYMAIAGAVTTASITHSMAFMAMFGAGTLPAMLAFSYLGASLTLPVRQTLRKAIPYGITIMAILLILRGLNLGIPFVSPVLQHDPGLPAACYP